MVIKKYTNNSLDSHIQTALLFEDSGRSLYIFSDYDEDLTCAIMKCYLDNKYEKVTEEVK